MKLDPNDRLKQKLWLIIITGMLLILCVWTIINQTTRVDTVIVMKNRQTLELPYGVHESISGIYYREDGVKITIP